MLLLISVNGDKNDEKDRYLNGYADLQLKKGNSSVFLQTFTKDTLNLSSQSVQHLHHKVYDPVQHVEVGISQKNPTPKHTEIDEQYPYATDYRNLLQSDSQHEESQAPHNQGFDPIYHNHLSILTFGLV